MSHVVNNCVVKAFDTNQESRKTHWEMIYLVLLFVPEYALGL